MDGVEKDVDLMGFEAITGPNFIAPTPPTGDSSNRVATTAFVSGKVASVKIQVFTGAGTYTYTPSAGMVYCIIECLGGGGGGGGGAGTANYALGAGGGGAGSYSRALVSAATVGVSQTVTIGTAGSGGAAG